MSKLVYRRRGVVFVLVRWMHASPFLRCMLAEKHIRKLRRHVRIAGVFLGVCSAVGVNERERTAPSSGQKTRARHSSSVAVDQDKIFDFDAFIRAHYGEQLQRDKELRQRKEKILRKQKAQYDDVKLGRMKEVAVGMLLVMAMAIVFTMRSSN